SHFFFQAEDGIRDFHVTGVQTCALPIFPQVLMSGIFMPIGGKLFDKIGARWLAIVGLLAIGGGLFMLGGVTTETSAVLVMAALRSEERRVGKECRAREATSSKTNGSVYV